ncbi:uncharacterized protein LOC125209238 [Salvia hispanica]|uniref:uncharacterized protein LOC125209238 n=1 Tax=Salvia hispanica TaxID=49212 RepID=UPI0020091150|nr:uncharacterized protein LOC125209238 [Salvia hispanica]
MKTMADGIQDLIREAKLRTVWWILCIFTVTYFLTHTSKSMVMNIPVAILLVAGMRILFNEVDFQWKVRNVRATSYLSHLEKKQLSANDSRLSTKPPSPQEWKRKIDSPVVEAALEEFVNKALTEFVIDLWYSDITPDKEAPELIHAIIMEVFGDIAGRLKEVNLVELLTRDIVDLIGDHIDLFRRNQIVIGRDVMNTLSSEERDEKLKRHLMASKELHPALISSECEYKVIQQLMGGLLAVVLRPTEARCPLIRCIARELLTCLIIQPLVNFANPLYQKCFHPKLQPIITNVRDLTPDGQRGSAKASYNEYVPKLRCRVIGAYFEKLGSTSFAVYSIAVTGANNITWFVKRRYRNFERLHRHLRDIPNYTLQLPPKRIFSSSTEDSFVHQRCIQLDKYLQDLLSIPNVSEQHEVWDFLSSSSKKYSFGKSTSVITTLAVNVDGAMDDVSRQFKGVSDGLMKIVAKSPSATSEPPSSFATKTVAWHSDDVNKLFMKSNTDTNNSFSDNEEGDKDIIHGQHEAENSSHVNGGQFDGELKEDPTGVPPEWTPPNLSVPVLNLVDNVFQLKRRGWLRRQVFWISKQILQLIMEDAIDDWLLRQIQWLRKEEVISQGIRLLQDLLWPGGKFFLTFRIQSKLNNDNKGSQTTSQQGGRNVAQPPTFEQQLEAARRASDVKKIIFDGAPAALVSLIGRKQYKRCARDIYYFIQSTICLKQLGYAILELVLITIFPEMRELVRDIHEKMHMQHSQF